MAETPRPLSDPRYRAGVRLRRGGLRAAANLLAEVLTLAARAPPTNGSSTPRSRRSTTMRRRARGRRARAAAAEEDAEAAPSRRRAGRRAAARRTPTTTTTRRGRRGGRVAARGPGAVPLPRGGGPRAAARCAEQLAGLAVDQRKWADAVAEFSLGVEFYDAAADLDIEDRVHLNCVAGLAAALARTSPSRRPPTSRSTSTGARGRRGGSRGRRRCARTRATPGPERASASSRLRARRLDAARARLMRALAVGRPRQGGSHRPRGAAPRRGDRRPYRRSMAITDGAKTDTAEHDKQRSGRFSHFCPFRVRSDGYENPEPTAPAQYTAGSQTPESTDFRTAACRTDFVVISCSAEFRRFLHRWANGVSTWQRPFDHDVKKTPPNLKLAWWRRSGEPPARGTVRDGLGVERRRIGPRGGLRSARARSTRQPWRRVRSSRIPTRPECGAYLRPRATVQATCSAPTRSKI